MDFGPQEAVKLLYEQGPIQRFTQDSPVLPDVWLAYAENPGSQQDLLLTPFQAPGAVNSTPGRLANLLEERLRDERSARAPEYARDKGSPLEIAYNQSTVALRLYFDELIRVVLPMSDWWNSRVVRQGLADEAEALDKPTLRKPLAQVLAGQAAEASLGPDVLWMIRVIGTILLVQEARREAEGKKSKSAKDRAMAKAWPPPDGKLATDAKRVEYFERVVSALSRVLKGLDLQTRRDPLVHLVSLNRRAAISVWRSRKAVKADAARQVFELSCGDITWAVVDSGIDARHPAFRQRDADGQPKPVKEGQDPSAVSRVVKTYDFTVIRNLLSTDPQDAENVAKAVRTRLQREPKLRTELRKSLQSGREIDWTLVMPLIEVPHDDRYEAPENEHGTHVAGILAADWRRDASGNGAPIEQDVCGLCSDIQLYDLRVLDEHGEGDEFNVMAALQFLRYLNSHKDFMVVHGVNLSLSIPHEVMNYACGRTPVCDECERLARSGVTVVAAAGNRGYMRATRFVEEAYRTISITDPGNAEEVITVGSTHRDMPHTYGVSYFSSRGPTGDGRNKPDLVAPGEKIESCVPGGYLKRLDGTSMAAPHVSGAAALLMARHRELIGQPRRIKEILCQTATPLGRERYFQGHGMLDVLRALQFV